MKRHHMHLDFGRETLLNKLQYSRDVHNWVPFVGLQKVDEGHFAIRKIFKNMLLHTGESVCVCELSY